VCRQIATPQARISPQHSDVLVPRDFRYQNIRELRPFVQTARSLMAQIVKMKTGNAGKSENSRKPYRKVPGGDIQRIVV
jgi:hypothetical protein